MRIDRVHPTPAASRWMAGGALLSGHRYDGDHDDIWPLLIAMRTDFKDLLAECDAAVQSDATEQDRPSPLPSLAQRLIAEWAVFLGIEDELLLPRLAAAGAPADRLEKALEGAQALELLIERLLSMDALDPDFPARLGAVGAGVDEHLRLLMVSLLAPLAREGVALHGLGAELAVARNDLLAELADLSQTRHVVAG